MHERPLCNNVEFCRAQGPLTSRLSRGKSVRLSDSLEARFYQELASERLVMRNVKGAPIRQWERIPGRQTESLDRVVYGLAVRALVNADVEQREDEVESKALSKPALTVVKSSWLSR